jgi:hypothetical protein
MASMESWRKRSAAPCPVALRTGQELLQRIGGKPSQDAEVFL